MKKVVIVGGGFSGAYCAKKLQKTFDVTLIDTKDYYEFTPSILRTLTEINHLKKIQKKHTDYLPQANIIIDKVTTITPTLVKTKTKEIFYDYLILASGSTYSIPIKEQGLILATRGKHLKEAHEKLARANTILIIGGGLVGVELAAEIIEHYPNKKVTIAQSGNTLMKRMSQKACNYAEEYLRKKGVIILKNERVNDKKNNTYTTTHGNIIIAELAFLCTGISPNTDYLKEEMKELLDEKNNIKVSTTLQTENYHNIFASGDITNIKEEKTAQNAEHHAKIIIKNILRKEKGKTLKEYIPKSSPMVISLGKKNGILIYKNIVLTGIIPGILKSIIEYKAMKKY